MYDSSSDAFANVLGGLFGLSMFSFSFIWMALYCLMIVVGIAGLVLWVIMLIDVAKREEKDFPDKGDNQKMIWLLVVIFGGWIGALVYYFVVYKKARK